MSNYTKATNFAVKDGLVTTDPAKIIKGTDIDNEYNAISNAISSKADVTSPSLLGTPTAPTASAGTNNTQIATTAFVTAALSLIYPVGSVYINASVNTSPTTLLGFGTWEAFGAGKVMVGLDSADTLFDTLEETGGSKDAIVVAHTHTLSGNTGGQSASHTHPTVGGVGNAQGGGGTFGAAYVNGTSHTSTSGTNSVDHTHSFSGTTASTGSSGTNANVQPFIVVKMWKRTA